MRYLVTGANGFVGKPLCAELLRRGHSVRAAVRTASSPVGDAEVVEVGAIDGETNWTDALRNVEAVIHLAARVHVIKDAAADPLAEFLRVNMQGTANLVYQAAAAGVKRFVFVSTIKVNGEHTTETRPFTESDPPDPQDAYAISKWRAEQVLPRVAQESGIEIVVVRPPLVYGPGVRGNFIRLLAAVDRGIPMPIAGVHNRRSMICVGNLVDALILCANHPAAAGKTYLVRDGEDISIPDLVRQMAAALGRPARLLPLPIWLLRGLGRLVSRVGTVERLVGSLRVDDALIRSELGWAPGITLQEGLESTAAWYRANRGLHAIPTLEKRIGQGGPECKVSVVIVNYNGGDILLECVQHALTQAGQVIVVDNASADGSPAALETSFPEVNVIRNRNNLGFAKACNLGARAAEGEHILFLNPDCILEPDAITLLLEAIHSKPGVGMVGGLLTNPDGSEQVGGRRAVPTPWRSFVRAFGLSALGERYPRLFSDFLLHKQPLPEGPVEVEAISGACMLVRRDALEEVGLLDEGYFMHCEDLDWCMRFRQKGWSILFVPGARMVHHKGHCSKSRPVFVEWHKHRGMVRFYRKFFLHQYPGALMWLVALGIWLRFAAITGRCLLSQVLRQARLRRS